MTASQPWWHRDRHADRRPLLRARQEIKEAVRGYFLGERFIEAEPGCLQISPGNELHLEAFATELVRPNGTRVPRYLATSPEFAMKKLIAAGETRLFAFAPAFRKGERGALHAPEFTMLEWYRADAGDQYAGVQADCRQIIAAAAEAVSRTIWGFRNRSCNTNEPFAHWSVAEAMARLFEVDLLATIDPERGGLPERLAVAARAAGFSTLADESWGDIFSKLIVAVERGYGGLPSATAEGGLERALLLDLYPAELSPLAKRAEVAHVKAAAGSAGEAQRPDLLARRFEVFVAGVELANGFGEETDASKVRTALSAEMDARQARYGSRYPIDDDFIAAVGQMPSGTAGCALGFDRLVMLAAGASHIDQVQWTPAAP